MLLKMSNHLQRFVLTSWKKEQVVDFHIVMVMTYLQIIYTYVCSHRYIACLCVDELASGMIPLIWTPKVQAMKSVSPEALSEGCWAQARSHECPKRQRSRTWSWRSYLHKGHLLNSWCVGQGIASAWHSMLQLAWQKKIHHAMNRALQQNFAGKKEL